MGWYQKANEDEGGFDNYSDNELNFFDQIMNKPKIHSELSIEQWMKHVFDYVEDLDSPPVEEYRYHPKLVAFMIGILDDHTDGPTFIRFIEKAVPGYLNNEGYESSWLKYISVILEERKTIFKDEEEHADINQALKTLPNYVYDFGSVRQLLAKRVKQMQGLYEKLSEYGQETILDYYRG